MKKAPAIVAVSALLVLLSFRMIALRPTAATGSERLTLLCSYLALAVLSLVTAAALWRGTSKALALFVAWSLSYLAVGGLHESLSGGTPLLEIALWWALVGTVLLAVGAHLRWVMGRASQ